MSEKNKLISESMAHIKEAISHLDAALWALTGLGHAGTIGLQDRVHRLHCLSKSLADHMESKIK